MRSKNDAEKTTSLKMWLLKRLKMDGFNASICRTSWATSFGCPAGESLSPLSIHTPPHILKAITSLIFSVTYLCKYLFGVLDLD
jgi:hypothetical protein